MDEEVLSLEIPMNIENLQLPNPSLLNYYKDAEKRMFWLDGEIDGSTLGLVKAIMRINHEDAQAEIPIEQRVPIRIFIDSNGGDVQVMWSLMNAIKLSKTPVYTIVYCMAMSAGSYILAAGHKRFALPGSTILVHSGGVGYRGTVEQVDSAKKYYDKLDKSTTDFFVAHTKITPKELKRKGAVDWYMSADDALKYGIVDRIVETLDEVM